MKFLNLLLPVCVIAIAAGCSCCSQEKPPTTAAPPTAAAQPPANTNSTQQPKAEFAALQGVWKGKEVGKENEGTCSFVVNGKTMEFRGADGSEWYKGDFTVTDGDPLLLHATIRDCPDSDYVGKTVHAIYRIEGDVLTIAGNEPGKLEAPASFDTPGGRQFVFRK